LDRYLLQPATLEQAAPDGRDSLSALRLEVQELALDIRKQVRQKGGDASQEEDQVEDTIEEIANDLDTLLAQVSEERNGS